MSTRRVIASIISPASVPREGLPVWFYPSDGSAPVVAMTDASGDMRVELDTSLTYRVPVENAVTVDGLPFPAGTVFVVQVPDGEGTATAAECLAGTVNASRPALIDLIAAQGEAIAALTARMDALEVTP